MSGPALLVDSATGRRVWPLRGHLDYSFAAAWHPGGTYLATGNQDTTTRIWDIRCLRSSVAARPRTPARPSRSRFLAASRVTRRAAACGGAARRRC